MQMPAGILVNVIPEALGGRFVDVTGRSRGGVGWVRSREEERVTRATSRNQQECVGEESRGRLRRREPLSREIRPRARLIVIDSLLADGCENKKCEFYAECESDSVGEAKCTCPANCEATVSSRYKELVHDINPVRPERSYRSGRPL